MLKRITLHNYMSHSHTVIDLSEGLTVLTGPNNCGKSAFVSALQNMTENTKGNYMIRHGAKECRVIVETDDGHTIEWKRKKKNASYCIDGVDIHRKTPEQLDKVLRLAKVKSGDSDEFDVHFGVQKSPIFLLGDPGSRAARFFASSSDASKLIEMQKLHRTKVKAAQQEFQWQQAESKQITDTLDTLKPIPDLESRLEALEQVYQNLTQEAKQLQHLESLIQEWEQVTQRVDLETRFVACLGQLPDSLEQSDETALTALVSRWQAIEEERRHSEQTAVAVQSLSEPPRLEAESTLEALIQNIAFLDQLCQRSGELQSCLDVLSSPPGLTEPDQLEQLIRNWELAEERVQLDRETAEVLQACEAPPEMLDGERLAQLCQQWASAEAEWQQMNQRHSEVESEYERIRAELLHWVEENPTCPTCGAEWEPDQFMQAAETGLKGHLHGT